MENQKKNGLPAFAILGIIALIAAIVLAGVNMITAPVIEANEKAAQRAAFEAIMPADDYETVSLPDGYDGVTTLVKAVSGGSPVGYCVTAAKAGYGGPVDVTLGVDANGIVTGAKIGTSTEFAETAGLGNDWKKPEYCERLVGLDAVNGGSFDAKTGATVTSNAVKDAVDVGLHAVAEVAMGKTVAADPLITFGSGSGSTATAAGGAASYPENGVITGTAPGFGGDVTVTLTLENSLISAVEIDASSETDGLGKLAEEDAFKSTLIGKQLPLSLGSGIDAIAGATVTSNAVVTALNEGEVNGTAVTGTAAGFGGDVTVTAELDADGVITAMKVEAPNETDGLGKKAEEEAFTSQFVGKTLPVSLGSHAIDAIAGATVTSTAVVQAANSATEPVAYDLTKVAGQTLDASGQGFGGEVTANVSFDENGAITALTVSAPDETEGLGKLAEGEAFTGQFIGKTIPVALGTDVDALAGATITSTAVVDMINGLAMDKAAQPAAEEAPAEETAPAGEEAPAADAAAAGAVTASKQGFQSEVKVTAELDGNTIKSLTVDSNGETAGLGQNAMNEAFTSQFIGKSLPIAMEDVEAITGATITTTAVVDALNSLAAPAEETPAEPVAEEAAAGAVTASKQGFQSEVKVTAELDGNTIKSLTVDSNGETAGLGQNAMNEAFTSQFIGKSLPIAMEDVEAITGATITTTAVVDALNSLAAPAEETPAEPVAEEAAAGALTASKQGFQSEVKVTAELDGNTIKSLTVDSNGETAGLGQNAMTEAFTSQFIGKTLPIAMEDVEAITGATITTTAVVDALNSLAAPAEETPAEPVAEEAAAGALTASKQGFQSEVKVTAELDGNTIKSLTVDSNGETAGLGQNAMNEAFTSQFIGKSLPIAMEDVEAITGATITTTAVVDALNSLAAAPAEEATATDAAAAQTAKAFGFASDVAVTVELDGNTIKSLTVDANGETAGLGQNAMNEAFTAQFIGKSLPIDPETVDGVAGATLTTTAVVNALNSLEAAPAEAAPAAEEAPAEEATVTDAAAAAQTAKAFGFASDVAVTVELDGNMIKSLTVDANGETAGLGQNAMNEAFTAQFIGKTLPIDPETVDGVAGATLTTTAVVNALNSLEAAPAEAAPAAEEAPAEEATVTDAAAAAQTAKAFGFASDVAVTVELDGNMIKSLTVDANGETAGLGQNAMNEAFTAQFIGKTLPIDPETVDGIAGATLTTTAVVNALNSLETAPAEAAPAAEEAPAEEATATDAAAAQTAKAFGFASDVAVTVELDGNTIKSLTVDANGETAGLGQNAMAEAFTSQFIGKTLPIDPETVDGVAGATLTTTAVVNALNSLEAAPAEAAPAAEEATATDAAAAQTAKAFGFASDVAVTVELDGNTIKSLTVDANGETAGLGQNAMNEAFISQFIGKTLPIAIEDVDAIAGATLTTTAVVNALNSLAE